MSIAVAALAIVALGISSGLIFSVGLSKLPRSDSGLIRLEHGEPWYALALCSLTYGCYFQVAVMISPSLIGSNAHMLWMFLSLVGLHLVAAGVVVALGSETLNLDLLDNSRRKNLARSIGNSIAATMILMFELSLVAAGTGAFPSHVFIACLLLARSLFDLGHRGAVGAVSIVQ